jgi:hypothetical protein
VGDFGFAGFGLRGSSARHRRPRLRLFLLFGSLRWSSNLPQKHHYITPKKLHHGSTEGVFSVFPW